MPLGMYTSVLADKVKQNKVSLSLIVLMNRQSDIYEWH